MIIIDKVTELKNYLIQLYQNEPEVIGIFLSGSCATGTYDEYSDVDIRFIIQTDDLTLAITKFKKQILYNSKQVLFFEPCCFDNAFIAHFDNFIKADVFFYTKEMLEPSPWLKEIKIIKDSDSFLFKLKTNSFNLQFNSTNQEIEQSILKYFALSHECFRRIKRDEYLYANALLQNMKEIIIEFYDNFYDRANLSWYKVEKRFENQLLHLLSSYINKNFDNIKILKQINKEFLDIEQKLCYKRNIYHEFENDKHILTYYYD